MRLVERPHAKPNRCAANPSIGQSRRDLRWIDTGSEMDGFDNHIYLSEPSVRDAAKLLGFPSQGEYAALLEERDRLALELEKLKADLKDAVDTLKAISTVQAAGLTVTQEG
jgi:hypothetical protein